MFLLMPGWLAAEPRRSGPRLCIWLGRYRAGARGRMNITADPIARDPERLEGPATFTGTRVPVWVLFNYWRRLVLVDRASTD